MGDSETGQVSEDAAQVYEEIYLPALFDEWCQPLITAAGVRAGDRILDVACGTGALALAVAAGLGPRSSVTGVDINDGMLKIARSKSASIEWRQAPAEALPFDDEHFDRVISQFGLMYFEQPQTALREMARVLRPGGTLAVAVWNSLDNNPGLAAEEYLWQKVFGEEIDTAPYRFGDTRVLRELFRAAGLPDAQIETLGGTAVYDSIGTWIQAGARGWTDDDALSDDQLQLLISTAKADLARFSTARGTVSFPTSAHIVSTTKWKK